MRKIILPLSCILLAGCAMGEAEVGYVCSDTGATGGAPVATASSCGGGRCPAVGPEVPRECCSRGDGVVDQTTNPNCDPLHMPDQPGILAAGQAFARSVDGANQQMNQARALVGTGGQVAIGETAPSLSGSRSEGATADTTLSTPRPAVRPVGESAPTFTAARSSGRTPSGGSSNSGSGNGPSSGSGSGTGSNLSSGFGSAELSAEAEAAGSAYGSGGSGRGGLNLGGSGGEFRSAFQSGSGGSDGSGEMPAADFGSGAQGARVDAMGSADPEDYFTRTGIADSLFKTVERKYREKSMQWISSDLKR